MIVKLLTEHHLEFLSLKGGCTGLSVSTHVKIPHCWKFHTLAHYLKGYEDLQDDIYEFCRWTTKWLLFFNANKCKVLHIGNKNSRFGYEMTDKTDELTRLMNYYLSRK